MLREAPGKGEEGQNSSLSLVDLASELTSKLTSKVSASEVLSEAANSATGTLFSGERTRTFDKPRRFPQGWEKTIPKTPSVNDQSWKNKDLVDCEDWAVVTTIFAPTEAVKAAASLPQWCMVIVADTKTPENYMEDLTNMMTSGETSVEQSKTPERVHFLSVDEQKKWASTTGKMAEFVDSIPYRHFARKNIGYLFAIAHGAKFIFDFDDDNILLDDGAGATLDPIANRDFLEGVRVPLLGKNAFNHHDLMSASIEGSWARGFPLELLQDSATKGKLGFVQDPIPMENIAVMQYCANGDPDVDAIHRMVKPLPMDFDRDLPPLQVPIHAFAPYNAQASIHTYNALWATFLPYSVPGRVSDIWRSYFAEAIFGDLGLSVTFLAPNVRQDRNAHNYLADMQAELDLYFKSGKLIEFLGEGWNSIADTVPGRMEELWIELYERGYIQVDDVIAIQMWLQALVEAGYRFPEVTRRRYNNVVLMGQFNYAQELDHVLFWSQKWREVFRHVVLRGPFDEKQLDVLHSHGIQVSPAKADKGYVSPYENLMLELNQFKDVPGIDGVLYLHDDAYLNMQSLTNGQYPFPADHIMGSLQIEERNSPFAYRVKPDGTYTLLHKGVSFASSEEFAKANDWLAWGYNIRKNTEIAADKRSKPYKDSDGSFFVPQYSQSDVLFVPTSVASEYATAAELFLDHDVGLESALATIANMVSRMTKVPITSFSLCTSWDRSERGRSKMLQRCQESDTEFTMYHPFKVSQRGKKDWGYHFDAITFGHQK
jgi:hypothetical protein